MPTRSSTSRFKRPLIKILFYLWRHKFRCLIGLFVVLFGSEIAFEVNHPSLGLKMLSQENLWRQNSVDCLKISTEIDYEPIPNECERNELGIRVMPVTGGEDSASRILILGDSISDGGQYVDTLQERLNAESGPSHWQVWNAGVTGYNLYQEYYLLKKRFSSVRPKLIIFQVCPNDLGTGVEVVRLQEEARNLFFTADGHARLWFKILLNFRLAEYAFFNIYGKPMPVQVRMMHPSMSDVLDEIRSFAQESQVPVLFAVFPFLSSRNDDPWVQTYRQIVENIRETRMHYYLIENVLEQPLEQFRVNPAEGIHPNQKAHQIVGEALAEFLKQQQYFQSDFN